MMRAIIFTSKIILVTLVDFVEHKTDIWKHYRTVKVSVPPDFIADDVHLIESVFLLRTLEPEFRVTSGPRLGHFVWGVHQKRINFISRCIETSCQLSRTSTARLKRKELPASAELKGPTGTR